MTKHLLTLIVGALLFAIGLSDLVGGSRISPYIILAAGLGLGGYAAYRIQKQEPKA